MGRSVEVALFCRPRQVRLITKVRKNMHNRLLPHWKTSSCCAGRAIIESINDQLKNVCQIEHSRHRSPINFLVHLLSGLMAYYRQPKKPSLFATLEALPAA